MAKVHGNDPAPEPAAGAHKIRRIFPSAAPVIQDDDNDEDEAGEMPLKPDGQLDDPSFVQMTVVQDSSSQFQAPSSFMERDAYKQLSDMNLTSLPPLLGCGLWYHSSSHQWHAYRGQEKKENYAPSWGPELRSEAMAILLAIQRLWQWYHADCPECKIAEKQLEAIKGQIAKTPFWLHQVQVSELTWNWIWLTWTCIVTSYDFPKMWWQHWPVLRWRYSKLFWLEAMLIDHIEQPTRDLCHRGDCGNPAEKDASSAVLHACAKFWGTVLLT